MQDMEKDLQKWREERDKKIKQQNRTRTTGTTSNYSYYTQNSYQLNNNRDINGNQIPSQKITHTYNGNGVNIHTGESDEQLRSSFEERIRQLNSIPRNTNQKEYYKQTFNVLSNNGMSPKTKRITSKLVMFLSILSFIFACLALISLIPGLSEKYPWLAIFAGYIIQPAFISLIINRIFNAINNKSSNIDLKYRKTLKITFILSIFSIIAFVFYCMGSGIIEMIEGV